MLMGSSSHLNQLRHTSTSWHVALPCASAARRACRPSTAASSPSTAAAVADQTIVHPEIGQVLFTPAQLHTACQRLGRQIGADYHDKEVVAIGVVKGGFMFLADLVREVQPLPRAFQVDFFKASSYGMATSTSGTVRLDDGFNIASIVGKHVLLVEDIVDTGLTMTAVVRLLIEAGASSVKVCTLLDKKVRRKVPLEADYVGFTVPDVFVVGYGIDYAENYRYLPYIGVPKDEFIKKH